MVEKADRPGRKNETPLFSSFHSPWHRKYCESVSQMGKPGTGSSCVPHNTALGEGLEGSDTRSNQCPLSGNLMVVSSTGLPRSFLLDGLSASFDAAAFAFSPHWARLVISARCCSAKSGDVFFTIFCFFCLTLFLATPHEKLTHSNQKYKSCRSPYGA